MYPIICSVKTVMLELAVLPIRSARFDPFPPFLVYRHDQASTYLVSGTDSL
jgi:hypothetical protein